MKLKMICCEVFMRMAFAYAAKSPHMIDIEFIPVRAHEDSDGLRKTISERIAAIDAGRIRYDAVLLGYGLCGNSLAGVQAGDVKLVLPRAHDCCTVFLGSRAKFREYFGDKLSARWTSHGYMERCDDYLRDTDTGKLLGMDQEYDELVEKYGEENAAFIWETIHPAFHSNEIVYIRIPEFDRLGFEETFQKDSAENGNEVTWIDGDTGLFQKFMDGDWNDEEFLTVEPGRKITPTYDLDRVFEAK